jgi:hypothetical protein
VSAPSPHPPSSKVVYTAPMVTDGGIIPVHERQ